VKLNLFKRSNTSANKILVLMYHRIADVNNDPWQLAVSPGNFEQHLRLLQKKFYIITVPELLVQLNDKSITSNSVCLTFDDGYADNFHVAKLLLEKYKCSATFFVPSQNLLEQQAYWWDELEQIILNTIHLPVDFSGFIGSKKITVHLGNESILTEVIEQKHNKWRWPDKPPTQRCELYLRLWEILKPLPTLQLNTELVKIKTWAGENNSANTLPMTADQLQMISAHPLFGVGMHTATHASLSAHSYDVQVQEILENKKILEQYCNRSISTIAFPYGDYSEVTLNIIKALELDAAFSTKEASITNESIRTCLSRFQVNNWDKNFFEMQLLTWFKNA